MITEAYGCRCSGDGVLLSGLVASNARRAELGSTPGLARSRCTRRVLFFHGSRSRS